MSTIPNKCKTKNRCFGILRSDQRQIFPTFFPSLDPHSRKHGLVATTCTTSVLSTHRSALAAASTLCMAVGKPIRYSNLVWVAVWVAQAPFRFAVRAAFPKMFWISYEWRNKNRLTILRSCARVWKIDLAMCSKRLVESWWTSGFQDVFFKQRWVRHIEEKTLKGCWREMEGYGWH